MNLPSITYSHRPKTWNPQESLVRMMTTDSIQPKKKTGTVLNDLLPLFNYRKDITKVENGELLTFKRSIIPK